MGAVLQRVTTAYLENEDRLRLTGELADGDTVVCWLTQRLLNRLVPGLIKRTPTLVERFLSQICL